MGTPYKLSPNGITCSPVYKTIPVNLLFPARLFLNQIKCLKCSFVNVEPALTSIPYMLLSES